MILVIGGGILCGVVAGLGLFCWFLRDLQRVSDQIEREREE